MGKFSGEEKSGGEDMKKDLEEYREELASFVDVFRRHIGVEFEVVEVGKTNTQWVKDMVMRDGDRLFTFLRMILDIGTGKEKLILCYWTDLRGRQSVMDLKILLSCHLSDLTVENVDSVIGSIVETLKEQVAYKYGELLKKHRRDVWILDRLSCL
jgi:hypothetical protein